MKRCKLQGKKAFTLVELLVVIVIIGILFVVLISNVEFSTKEARATGAQSDLRAYSIAANTAALANAGFSQDINTLAQQLNKYLDPELQVAVKGGVLETNALDPWGKEYIVTTARPQDTLGEVSFISAGADSVYFTSDDQVITVTALTNGAVDITHPMSTPHVHVFEKIEWGAALKTPSTCKTPATYYYSCQECKMKSLDSFTSGVVNPDNHVNEETRYLDNGDGTHTMTRKCTDCGTVIHSTVEQHANEGTACPDCNAAAHFHSYNKQVANEHTLAAPASCSEAAKYYKSCACGAKGDEIFTSGSPLGHDFSAEKVDSLYLATQATCTSAATYYKSCSRCPEKGAATFSSGDKGTHIFDQKKTNNRYLVSSATCEQAAVYNFSCTCGEEGTEEFIYGEALGHSYSQPTCTISQLCTRCSKSSGEANGHQEVPGGTAGTHTKCKICGIILDTEHTEMKAEIVKVATCSAMGQTKYTCDCGYSVTLTDIDKNLENHSGAETGGKTDKVHTKWSCCGVTISTEHQYSSTVTQAPTCSTYGRTQYTCSCGYSYADTQVPKVPHIFEREVMTSSTLWLSACCIRPDTYYYSCVNCNTTSKGSTGETFTVGTANLSKHAGSVVSAGEKDVHTKYSCCGLAYSTTHNYTIDTKSDENVSIEGIKYYTCSCNYSYSTIKTLGEYTWDEIRRLSDAQLSAAKYKEVYGIEVGNYKEVNGVTYVLVDIDGNGYGGFVFMYNAKISMPMNTSASNAGGYGAYAMSQVESLYKNMDNDLKSAIKSVNVNYNEGYELYGTSPYTTSPAIHLFLASYKEVGFTDNLDGTYANGYNAEGTQFDLFVDQTSRADFATLAEVSDYWWLRSACSLYTNSFCNVYKDGGYSSDNATTDCSVVPCFVVGTNAKYPVKNSLNDYTWEEIQSLAGLNLDIDTYQNVYHIRLGDKKIDSHTYVLLDLDGNDYDGFVFMGLIGSYYSETGTYPYGYAYSNYAKNNSYHQYQNFSTSLKNVIKPVTIHCADITSGTITHMVANVFRPSIVEFFGEDGIVSSSYVNSSYVDLYRQEGEIFDIFKSASDSVRQNLTGLNSEYGTRSPYDGNSVRYFTYHRSANKFYIDFSSSSSDNPCFVVGTYDHVSPKESLNDYSWVEIKNIAKLNLTADELESQYNIHLGDFKIDESGNKYYLIDLDGNNYDGFVFAYDSEKMAMNSTNSSSGGYSSSELMTSLNDMFLSLSDVELRGSISRVSVTSGNYQSYPLTSNSYKTSVTAGFFIPSLTEVGGGTGLNNNYSTSLSYEGTTFDYFIDNDSRKAICNNNWWTRTIVYNSSTSFYAVDANGNAIGVENSASTSIDTVICFVIG